MVKDFDDLGALFAHIRNQVGSGRKMIYAALAQAYELLYAAQKNDDLKKRISKAYKEKWTPQKNTDFPAKVARLAIDDEAKTSNPYAANFRAALEQDVSAEEYPDWLEKHGIYLMKPITGNQPDAGAVSQMVEKGADAVAKVQAKATFDLPDGVRPESNVAILVIRQRTIGEASASIIDVIDDYDDAALRGILQKYAKSADA